MQLPQAKTLLLNEQHGMLTITLNRPHARNAMTLEMIGELLNTLAAAEADPNLRALVVRGAGGHFCAGADIKDLAAARMRPITDGIHPVAAVNASFGRLCLAYARTPLPLVCVLEGAVMGGGFGLSCVSDVTLATGSAVFALPETSLGVIPAQIAPFLVERLGFAQAKRLALTGGQITAAEALTLGLVHELHHAPEELEAGLARTLARFRACAPLATRATKQLLQRVRVESAETLIDDAARLFAEAATGPEGIEGTMAFLQKRRPAWAGDGS